MSPILGIWASAQQPALNATSFESIATVTVGAGGSSTVTFSSIPSTYTHLQLRLIARNGTTSSSDSYLTMQFNSDTSSNYSAHQLYGDGASAASNAWTNSSVIYLHRVPGAGTGSTFGTMVIDILNYANTNKYKTTRTLGGYDANGSGRISLSSGNWRSTNAINSIVLAPELDNFNQYSSFALYGIKG